jgi:hypothetical protein
MLFSATAIAERIDNTPSPEVMGVLIETARKMDVIRDFLGYPIYISSWYRSPALCLAIGSKPTSQHTKGEAVDWSCPIYMPPEGIALELSKHMKELEIDQLILERRGGKEWIHTSFALNPPRVPRGQVLSLLASGQYAIGLIDKQGKQLT